MRLPHAAAPQTTRRERPRRVLYFDIDGTLVQQTFGAAKRSLANGRFERLVRAAGFDELVCVSDAVSIGRLVATQREGHDAMETVLQLSRGTIADAHWFAEHVRPVFDPLQRARFIDTNEDWYFVDDWATVFLERAHPESWLEYLRDGRVLQCNAAGCGDDVVAWLRRIAQRPPRGGATAQKAGLRLAAQEFAHEPMSLAVAS